MAAQSKQRQQNKAQNIRLPILGSYTNRDQSATKDQRFINIFPETRKVESIESTKIFLNKRPGLSLYKNVGTGEARGMIYFNSTFYYIRGDSCYKDGTSPTLLFTLGTSTGKVGMILGNSSTYGDYIFVCDGISGWVIKSNDMVLTISNTGLRSISVTSGGTTYLDAPIVYLTGGGGSGATATATISSGAIDQITVTNVGTGYTTAPTVSFQFTPTSVDATADTITYASHGLGTNVRVKITGTPPTGLTAGSVYYVVSPTTDTFKLSTTSGGAAVNITTTVTTFQVLTGAPATEGTAIAYLNAFPTPHIPTPTFIDGYIILPQRSDVYNCVLDEPDHWDSGQYLSAEMFPDAVVALARQNNQVIVFGKTSTEFFYDAANVNGSPLSRNDSTTLQTGCAMPYAIYQNEKTCIFVGQSDSGGRAVWQVDGFQPKKVSDEFIDRIIDKETSAMTCMGYGIRTMGHLFYVLHLMGIGRTLVYDTEEKLWHEWSDYTSGSHAIFPYYIMSDKESGSAYLYHTSNGNIMKVDTTKYQDDSTTICTEFVTNKYDMDTYKRKFLANLRLVVDRRLVVNQMDLV